MDEARAAVLEFLDEAWDWRRPLADDADLFDALGIDGDEGSDFIEAFVARFEVDATAYRWYFHHGEEGWSIGALFYRPIHRRFGHIPITLAVLTEAVRTRRWPIVYPEHVVPGPAVGYCDQPDLRGGGGGGAGGLGVDAVCGVGGAPLPLSLFRRRPEASGAEGDLSSRRRPRQLRARARRWVPGLRAAARLSARNDDSGRGGAGAARVEPRCAGCRTMP